MRKWILSLAVVALVATPIFAGKFNKVINIGEKAPSIDGLPAVMGSQESTLALGDIKEDVVVVVFLANHCPMVLAYEDRIIDLANSFKDKSVKVVAISCSGAENVKSQDDIPAIKVHAKEKGYNFIYAYDESGKVGKAFGAKVTPEFFVLDKDRKIQYTGSLDDTRDETKVKHKYVANAIDALLSGKTVETTETRAFGCGISYKR
jgi:peroxiredoxin